ncbi:hypothetical protein BDY19DRAFT_1046784 [Irpex rosettiformis]|uniref:Uncharacterized protein n=1 Tax=Irpex rosettiformis TaxID=378272 RepID=A0ACB8U9F6_9APHY|nr:hypothetical protein BDY19DRAFT_1046784 [Irpex rosettiformis]
MSQCYSTPLEWLHNLLHLYLVVGLSLAFTTSFMTAIAIHSGLKSPIAKFLKGGLLNESGVLLPPSHRVRMSSTLFYMHSSHDQSYSTTSRRNFAANPIPRWFFILSGAEKSINGTLQITVASTSLNFNTHTSARCIGAGPTLAGALSCASLNTQLRPSPPGTCGPRSQARSLRRDDVFHCSIHDNELFPALAVAFLLPSARSYVL